MERNCFALPHLFVRTLLEIGEQLRKLEPRGDNEVAKPHNRMFEL